ncbi:hypothetical protein JJB09_18395 [Rhizobium sp. KVB221]|uniref:Histidine kinase n=1 Tax=Rhizobium setariae TaxID=2801340 RepID=A0A936YSG6_9HYPH|nr:hypothetical protein [Rhizobium setariae]MBL0373997.1 hypothetical protein [Rhizobium setariae]
MVAALIATSAIAANKLGNLSSFEGIANDTLVLVDKGDLKGAEQRITDFASAWDEAEKTLYPKDKAEWSVIDDAADAAIESLSARSPSATDAQRTVSALIDTLRHPVAE